MSSLGMKRKLFNHNSQSVRMSELEGNALPVTKKYMGMLNKVK